ncbi:hypothetical protein EG329_013868 [Mollisiaceae sp. DMI_Dod_QoI]|nr:hypothetical protein EG329_013868 [Helotiales sp. DMI_Dod_QoI]
MPQRRMSIESTSTTTIRAMSEYRNAGPTDDEMQVDPIDISVTKPRYIIATDFGTTFSAVAFIRRAAGQPSKPQIISNYNDDPITLTGHPNVQVATESWYIEDCPNIVQTSMSGQLKGEESEDIYDDRDSEHDLTLGEESSVSEDDMDLDIEEPIDEPSAFFWGYEIQSLISPDMDRKKYNCIARSKLLLDKSERTQSVRDQLKPILERLKNGKNKGKRIIQRDEDVIADYLTQLFRHTKKELEKIGIPGDSEFEHVLCVPAIWDADACREMQNSVAVAIQATGLGSMDDFFLVSEPEAAAAFVLAGQRSELNAGEPFLLLDAGGGTVDATVYRVTERFPLRLSKEIIPADGRFPPWKSCLNGSSFVNAAFREHLRKRLEGEEKYIATSGYTLDGILDDHVKQFEQRTKKVIDVTDTRRILQEIKIQHLRPSERKRFRPNTVIMEKKDFEKIFNPSLNAISELMENQLTAAKDIGVEVEKVILVGGFSASKALRSTLQKKLDALSALFGYRIKLILPINGEPQTAVVEGAIIRAWDKEKGPQRFLKLSYGFQVTEQYDPINIEAHREVKHATLDPKDGFEYVHNTIEWLVFKDDTKTIPNRLVKSTVVYHIFPLSAKRLECEEILWVSSTCTESHYRKSHPKNKDAHIAGRITADMTFLKTQKLIQPIEPEKGSRTRKHYKVEVQLFLIIEGRNMRFEARWPKGDEGLTRAEGQ